MAAKLSIKQLRALLLHAQGLSGGAVDDGADAKGRALQSVHRMKALQIDTINVVARSPYLVLWSRIGDHEPAVLDRLLEEGSLFEYWSHAACFLPADHFPFYRSFALARSNTIQKRSAAWLKAHPELAERVLARIRDEGPLRSIDFERTDGRKGNGWWDWKEEKIALEFLFNVGTLMVRQRRTFQRVYDLAERVRPELHLHPLTVEEGRRSLIREATEALGVARPEWIANYLFLNQPKKPIFEAIRQMVAAGELEEVGVQAFDAPAYALPGWLEKHEAALSVNSPTVLLSPFDPVVWDRDRLAELFAFDYRIECYTPAPKRRYGYFSLPILHQGRMVGRLDPKAHRRQGVMEIKTLHLEPGVEPDTELVDGLRDVFGRFATWHGTPEVVVRESDPKSLKKALRIR